MTAGVKRQDATVNRMHSAFRRLSEAGFPEKFVREVALPEWWDDEAADTPNGLVHGLMLISRHLGVDLASFEDETTPIRLNLSAPCKLKKRLDAGEDDMDVVRAMAVRVAQLASAAGESESLERPTSAAEARRYLLNDGRPWVSFLALLDYCWSIGVPVIHLSRLPRGIRRPDGMAVLVRGLPVILLCCQRKSPAWLLFILAHELGHFCLGHVIEDGLLIDERVAQDDSEDDVEEQETNAFALELLTGRPRWGCLAEGRWPNASALASEAQTIGRRDRIDPAQIVLQYGHLLGRDFFPVANAALEILEKNQDAIVMLRECMAARLDWSALPEDSSTFLMRITQSDVLSKDSEEPVAAAS